MTGESTDASARSDAGPPPGSPVLVTGATGFTGSVLTRRLVARGARVTALVRPGAGVGHLADAGITWVRGDIGDGALVAEAMRGQRYVFHLAAAYRRAGLPEAEYRRVHVTSTMRLAEHAARVAGFRRFVHVSTIGVHGDVSDPPADERSPFRPGDVYQRTKADGELRIRDFAEAEGLPTTIMRPCAIYGPGDRRLWKLFRMARLGVFPLIGRGRRLYHLIHVEDLVTALLLAAGHPGAIGESFIVGNREWTTLDHMVRVVARALGRRVRFVRLPAAPVVACAAACEAVCRPLGLEPPLHLRRVAFFTKDRAFDTSKLNRVLRFVPARGNDDGLTDVARWYVNHGWL